MTRILSVMTWLKPALGKAGFLSPCFLTPVCRDLLFLGYVRVEIFPQLPLYYVACVCSAQEQESPLIRQFLSGELKLNI